ncbi:unnamed protein product [Allacma fusca]|uniref:Uncharacterized protein n=1 Tax=Allacma fusca TaxID=39272 RepID=A0A8J2JSK2_9HEXA|nr:unnamed protein product [Allacma fusca]
MCSRGLMTEEHRYIYNDLSYSLQGSGLRVWLKQSTFIWSRSAIRKIIMFQALTVAFIIIFLVFDFTFHATSATSLNIQDHLGSGIWIPVVSIPAIIFSAYAHGCATYMTVTVSALLQILTFALGTLLQVWCLQAAQTNLATSALTGTTKIWGGILYTVIIVCNAVILLASMTLWQNFFEDAPTTTKSKRTTFSSVNNTQRKDHTALDCSKPRLLCKGTKGNKF